MKHTFLCLLATLGILGMPSLATAAFTEVQLIAVRDGFAGRRDQMLRAQESHPYPAAKVKSEKLSVWNRLDDALAALYLKSDRLPEVNGQPIDLRSAKTFDSPFLEEDWAGGGVTITKGERRVVLNENH